MASNGNGGRANYIDTVGPGTRNCQASPPVPLILTAYRLEGRVQHLRQTLARLSDDFQESLHDVEALSEAVRHTGRAERTTASLVGLTRQEHRIAVMVADNLSNEEIAVAMHLSVQTVKTHLRHAFQKLRIHSRWEIPHLIGPHSQSEVSLTGIEDHP